MNYVRYQSRRQCQCPPESLQGWSLKKLWKSATKVLVAVVMAPVAPLGVVAATAQLIAPDSKVANGLSVASVISSPVAAALARATGSDLLNAPFENSPVLANLPVSCRKTASGGSKCSINWIPFTVVAPQVAVNAKSLETEVQSAPTVTQAQADFARALEEARVRGTQQGEAAGIQTAEAGRAQQAAMYKADLLRVSTKANQTIAEQEQAAADFSSKMLWLSAGAATVAVASVGAYVLLVKK